MNILLLSVGTRNKIVQYFKESLGDSGRVIATDMQRTAPAIYEADHYYLVPRITDPGYIDMILSICEKEHVDGVLSLIDPELSLIANNKERFEAVGTRIVGSSAFLCEMALDKWKMYLWLKDHNYSCAKTYIDFFEFEKDLKNNSISFPVFVKPRYGSASVSISKADNLDVARLLYNQQENMMVQQFLNGQEIGADVYIDMLSNEVVSVFTKKKLLMRAGETDKAISFKDDKLFELIEQFVSECGFSGQIDIDIFDIDGNYYLSEVNPRFGGGYPHAYECGINHMNMIRQNLQGIANERVIGSYNEGIVMMKYNEIKVFQCE